MTVISERTIKSVNFRIQKEEESARIYLAMSNWLTFNGYIGAGKLWKKYSDEEIVHAGFAREYLLNLDIQPSTPSLFMPDQNFKSFPEVVKLSYQHELDITSQCQDLAKVCVEENDFMTLTLAQKYLSEQVEEIAKMTQFLDRLNAFGDDMIALRLLDNEMGEL
jgi:ferritin